MTHDEFIKFAADRVADYLQARAKRPGIDAELIHSYNGIDLRWSDVNALVGAALASSKEMDE